MQMVACNTEDIKCSEKRVGGDDGMRTVECLRGRLLAERQASKIAKQDAQLMESKLLELENKLKEETKLRNKAEKRFKLLKKKLESLESLKILPNLDESEKSSSSESSTVSSVSSASSSGTQHPHDAVPEISKNVEENASDTNPSIKSFEICSNEENSTPPPGTSTKSDTSCSSLKASKMEINMMNGRNETSEDDEYVDNSLALVPLNLPETKVAPEINIEVSKSIGEVLDNLRHARERIQSTMERRQMIRVGAILNSYM
ncbi:hypothetical protein J1N35_041204 [Gossypium stocksii]|uniref:Uncharacterized protein n=1 Tax=Gossypium stocksii TaxID=47602 RepID=A0A9D3ZJ75_9ROSI|nr:hypothetical protein J1N35_041204 [Gossypium stocksii]